MAGGRRFHAGTILWAAGVRASPVAKSLGLELDRAGRVPVEPDLSVPGHPNVFVIGDLAAMKGDDGKPLPGVAQVAIQQGTHAAKNIVRTLNGDERTPFSYRDKGNMATLGRNKAIADIRGIKLSGFVAWMAWLAIHIYFLIGFRNRLAVILQWAWSYLRFGRGARLITSTGYDQTREIV
jgi:NADH dehydrogenase